MQTLVVATTAVLACLTASPWPRQHRTAARSNGAAVFEVALWPGEGRPLLVAGTTKLVPRTEPRREAPAGPVLHVRKGQALEFGDTLYRTTKAGRVKVLEDSEIAGRRLGSVARVSRDDYYGDRYVAASFSVRAGEVVEYLQARAEGSCFIRVRGEVMDVDPCPHLASDPAFVLEAEPRTEWWVQLVVERRPRGWVLVDGKHVREGGRTF